ncbi:MAG: hypothetical protein CR988_01095 [Treponema sp.]|nr:MAG: hypothetical protein CR988_01095 [Treponema sp.]
MLNQLDKLGVKFSLANFMLFRVKFSLVIDRGELNRIKSFFGKLQIYQKAVLLCVASCVNSNSEKKA